MRVISAAHVNICFSIKLSFASQTQNEKARALYFLPNLYYLQRFLTIAFAIILHFPLDAQRMGFCIFMT